MLGFGGFIAWLWVVNGLVYSVGLSVLILGVLYGGLDVSVLDSLDVGWFGCGVFWVLRLVGYA